MLDVARHFFPVADVKRLIDLAALLKLNHLHLHLTDDQGWRIAIDQWPRLTEYGGGTEVGDGPGGYYTKADYREIVAYAADRYHHGGARGRSARTHECGPGVATRNSTATGWRRTGTPASRSGSARSRCTKEITYRFLDEVFGELAALTPGPYLHIGGDEAKTLGPEDYASS